MFHRLDGSRRFLESRNGNLIVSFSVTKLNELLSMAASRFKISTGESSIVYFLSFKLVACFAIFTWTCVYSVVSDLAIPRTRAESWGRAGVQSVGNINERCRSGGVEKCQ